jgi:hypothetical protein
MKIIKIIFYFFLVFVFFLNGFAQNGDSLLSKKPGVKMLTGQLAPTPPMGWNTWNTFQTKISEDMLKEMVEAYIKSGMQGNGFQYFTLDDGWMSMERDQNGNLVADPQKFPHGMKAFADYVHSKGLKFGIYNCAGSKTGYRKTHCIQHLRMGESCSLALGRRGGRIIPDNW